MRQFDQLLTRTLEFVASACILIIVFTIITLVVLRYGFNASITGANEFVTILFVYTTAIGSAVELGRREHIAISYLSDKLNPTWQSRVAKIELLFVAILNAVMVVYSIQWIGITGDYIMPSTGLPRVAVQASVPIGCSLAVLYCVMRIFDGTSVRSTGFSRNSTAKVDSIPPKGGTTNTTADGEPT